MLNEHSSTANQSLNLNPAICFCFPNFKRKHI